MSVNENTSSKKDAMEKFNKSIDLSVDSIANNFEDIIPLKYDYEDILLGTDSSIKDMLDDKISAMFENVQYIAFLIQNHIESGFIEVSDENKFIDKISEKIGKRISKVIHEPKKEPNKSRYEGNAFKNIISAIVDAIKALINYRHSKSRERDDASLYESIIRRQLNQMHIVNEEDIEHEIDMYYQGQIFDNFKLSLNTALEQERLIKISELKRFDYARADQMEQLAELLTENEEFTDELIENIINVNDEKGIINKQLSEYQIVIGQLENALHKGEEVIKALEDKLNKNKGTVKDLKKNLDANRKDRDKLKSNLSKKIDEIDKLKSNLNEKEEYSEKFEAMHKNAMYHVGESYELNQKNASQLAKAPSNYPQEARSKVSDARASGVNEKQQTSQQSRK